MGNLTSAVRGSYDGTTTQTTQTSTPRTSATVATAAQQATNTVAQQATNAEFPDTLVQPPVPCDDITWDAVLDHGPTDAAERATFFARILESQVLPPEIIGYYRNFLLGPAPATQQDLLLQCSCLHNDDVFTSAGRARQAVVDAAVARIKTYPCRLRNALELCAAGLKRGYNMRHLINARTLNVYANGWGRTYERIKLPRGYGSFWRNEADASACVRAVLLWDDPATCEADMVRECLALFPHGFTLKLCFRPMFYADDELSMEEAYLQVDVDAFRDVEQFLAALRIPSSGCWVNDGRLADNPRLVYLLALLREHRDEWSLPPATAPAEAEAACEMGEEAAGAGAGASADDSDDGSDDAAARPKAVAVPNMAEEVQQPQVQSLLPSMHEEDPVNQ